MVGLNIRRCFSFLSILYRYRYQYQHSFKNQTNQTDTNRETLMPFQFKESPDRMRINALVSLSPDDYGAHTFCFPSRSTIAISGRPHTFIFNALKQVIRSRDSKAVSKIMKDYDCKLYGQLSDQDLVALEKSLSTTMGQQRLNTHAGRLWLNVQNPHIGRFHAISTWAKYSQISKNSWIIGNLIDHFKLMAKPIRPIYYEGIDFDQPKIYTTGLENQDGTGKRSSVDPSLTSDQIVDILVAAHTTPWSLTTREREVAFEFKGKPVGKRYQHLFPTDAEFKTKMTTSESVRWRSGLVQKPTITRIVESLLGQSDQS